MAQPYELLVRFGLDGKVAGASVRFAETVGGRTYPLDPQPLSGVDDPAFASFAAAFGASALAERDAAAAALAALRDSRAQELAAKDADKQAALDALNAAHAAAVAKLTADCQAAVAAQPVGSLSDSLTPLEQLYFRRGLATLNADRVAKGLAPVSAPAYFASLVSAQIEETLATGEARDALVQDAIGRALTLPDDAQLSIFTILGVAFVTKLPAEDRPTALYKARQDIRATLEAMDSTLRNRYVAALYPEAA